MTTTSRQTGFTLVELMVALLIGSIVVLGAGYLFFTTFQTFQKVDELSRKQEAVIFAAHTLSESIRSGDDEYKLECQLEQNDECQCTLRDTDNNNQPLVTFTRPLGNAELSDKACALEETPNWSKNVVDIPLPLEKDGEKITFQVTKRSWALNDGSNSNSENSNGNGKSPDPDNEGFYKDGTRMYNDRCYNGGGKFKSKWCDAP